MDREKSENFKKRIAVICYPSSFFRIFIEKCSEKYPEFEFRHVHGVDQLRGVRFSAYTVVGDVWAMNRKHLEMMTDLYRIGVKEIKLDY